jgi:hypothetical protein
MCYYALTVSSEGDVAIYDMEKAWKSEDEITNSWMWLASRETVSHHKRLIKVNPEELAE